MFRGLQRVLRSGSLGVVNGGFSSASAAADSQRLAGKVAVITGGASGIGKATAAEFVRNGARVIVADVQDDLGHAVAAELGPDVARYAHCDVTDEAQVAAAVDLAVQLHGRLDVMLNNAGIGGDMALPPVGAIDLANFDRVMVPRRAGSIICTASIAAVLGGAGSPEYSASKAAVVGIVRAVAAEVARSGVRINAISPHGIPTPLGMAALAQWFPDKTVEERRRIVEIDMNEMVVEGSVLEADHIARAALYLASDDARYVNGQNLVVDGGFTVNKVLNMPAPATSC